MNISELIQQTSYVRGFDASNTFSNKKFGSIYMYNKTVRTKPGSTIIEVSMMIKGATERVAGKDGDRTVSAHKVMVAIRGVNQRTVSAKSLIRDMRLKKEYYDKEKYSDEDLLAIASNPDMKPFKDQTIMPQLDGSFTIIEDNISKEAQIRVWCSCSSYYWVFQYYNVENGVDIWGKYPQRYVPKTKRGWEALQKNRPIRNPQRHPGMCKHIMLLLALLMDTSVIREARGVVNSYKANIARFQKRDRLSQEAYENVIKKYQADHRLKLQQRGVQRDSMGYAQIKEMKKGMGHWDSKNHKWVDNTRSSVRRKRK